MSNENTVEDNVITVGYAEDERWYRDDIVEMLESNGFKIVFAGSNGKELLDFADSSVNQRVAGSSPAEGAQIFKSENRKKPISSYRMGFLFAYWISPTHSKSFSIVDYSLSFILKNVELLQKPLQKNLAV